MTLPRLVVEAGDRTSIRAAPRSRNDEHAEQLEGRVKELEAENLDRKITNRAKDQFIEMAREERASFLEKLTTATRTIGPPSGGGRLSHGELPDWLTDAIEGVRPGSAG